ncbi:MAG: hypothetical protein GWN58_50155 [Anaerolineae bacterium]|nr:hypothetical protein [Anaerolineae bacterium]
MEYEPSSTKHHVIALIGNVIVFAGLSMAMYTISFLLTADLGGPLTCCAVPFLNGMCAAAYFPISIGAEQLLVNTLKVRRKKRYWVLAVAYFLSGLALVLLGALLSGAGLYENWRVGLQVILFYGSIPLVIGGPMYVLILRLGSLLLTARSFHR